MTASLILALRIEVTDFVTRVVGLATSTKVVAMLAMGSHFRESLKHAHLQKEVKYHQEEVMPNFIMSMSINLNI